VKMCLLWLPTTNNYTKELEITLCFRILKIHL